MSKSAPADAVRRLLPYAYAAAYLGVSLRGMKQLAADGEVPKVEIGARVLFDRVDLDAYVDRCKRGVS